MSAQLPSTVFCNCGRDPTVCCNPFTEPENVDNDEEDEDANDLAQIPVDLFRLIYTISNRFNYYQVIVKQISLLIFQLHCYMSMMNYNTSSYLHS